VGEVLKQEKRKIKANKKLLKQRIFPFLKRGGEEFLFSYSPPPQKGGGEFLFSYSPPPQKGGGELKRGRRKEKKKKSKQKILLLHLYFILIST